jgi:hypothetical protein
MLRRDQVSQGRQLREAKRDLAATSTPDRRLPAHNPRLSGNHLFVQPNYPMRNTAARPISKKKHFKFREFQTIGEIGGSFDLPLAFRSAPPGDDQAAGVGALGS